MSLFLFFKNINIKQKFFNNSILRISSFTLGVYLIHEQPLVRNILWNKVNINTYLNTPYFIIHMIVTVLSVFIVCCIIDFIRKKICECIGNMKIFNNLKIKYNRLIKKIENKLDISEMV